MSEARQPNVVVIAGPNGAGKSTAAPRVLAERYSIAEFVNADVIAKEISGTNPESHAMEAGRRMLLRLRELAEAQASFAFETTLASRTFAPWIRELLAAGYRFSLVFVYLPSTDMALARVAQRVRTGGHHVPDSDVRQRFERGLQNFFRLYAPLAAEWVMYNGSQATEPPVIARFDEAGLTVVDFVIWQSLEQRYAKGT